MPKFNSNLTFDDRNSIFYFLFSKFSLFILLSTFYFLLSGIPSANAAVLYLEPSQGEYHSGGSFIITAWVDTEGKDINAIEGYFSFSQDKLEIIDIGKGGSILRLWPEEPSWSNQTGKVSFIGGITTGFRGQGKLLSIIFRVNPSVTSRESASITFTEDSQVLLNDGFGTPAKVNAEGGVFTVLSERPEVPKDEWAEEIKKDKIPPEPFEIKISQVPEVFEGKYFIVFFTNDGQTGIDYYEILEADRRGFIRGTTRKAEWKRGDSPYLLEDQSLNSLIKVKVVDKAGNERIAEIVPPYRITWKDILLWTILGLITLGVIWRIIKRRIKK